MNFLNYKIFKTFILLVCILLIFLILIKSKKIKNKKILIIMCIILYVIYLAVPFDFLFLNFDSLENISKFYEPNQKQIEKYEYDDYAYIVYGSNGYFHTRYYIKEKEKWKIGKTKNGILKYKAIQKNNIMFYLYETSENKSIIIISFFINDNEYKNISQITKDSYDSKVMTKIYRKTGKLDKVLQIIILDKVIEENYKIYINNIEYTF